LKVSIFKTFQIFATFATSLIFREITCILLKVTQFWNDLQKCKVAITTATTLATFLVNRAATCASLQYFPKIVGELALLMNPSYSLMNGSLMNGSLTKRHPIFSNSFRYTVNLTTMYIE